MRLQYEAAGADDRHPPLPVSLRPPASLDADEKLATYLAHCENLAAIIANLPPRSFWLPDPLSYGRALVLLYLDAAGAGRTAP